MAVMGLNNALYALLQILARHVKCSGVSMEEQRETNNWLIIINNEMEEEEAHDDTD